jgi:hypothetical protein
LSIIDNPKAILLDQYSCRMPQIQTHMDVIPIPNLKLQEPLGSISQLQNFPPTPRTVLRNAYTPKTLSFHEIFCSSICNNYNIFVTNHAI